MEGKIKVNVFLYSRTKNEDYRWIYAIGSKKKTLNQIRKDFRKYRFSIFEKKIQSAVFAKKVKKGLYIYKVVNMGLDVTGTPYEGLLGFYFHRKYHLILEKNLSLILMSFMPYYFDFLPLSDEIVDKEMEVDYKLFFLNDFTNLDMERENVTNFLKCRCAVDAFLIKNVKWRKISIIEKDNELNVKLIK